MAEYIERTEKLMLAMNAGAMAIENTKRYHGAVYIKDLYSDNSQEIPYLLAAKVLREASDAPAADVAPVTRCKDCEYGDYDSKPDSAMVCLRTKDGFWRKETDFCSYGTPKNDGGET